MKAVILALALVAQTAAGAPPQQQPAKGAVTGVVLNGATGDPLPNVRVTLAKIDLPKSMTAGFAQAIGRDADGAPAGEVNLPVEFFEMMKAQMAVAQRESETLRKGGATDVPEDTIPPEMAFLKDLPLDDIQGMLVDPSGKLAIVSKSAPPMTSDGAGRFNFQNLEPGLYRLIFAANGFVRQDYGQRGAGSGTPVVVEAGRSVDGVTVRMTPTGAISGKLTDGAGQALAGIPVQLLRLAYDASGKRKAKTVASVQTNHRGEYRFYYLSPGRYTVQAGSPPARTVAEESVDDPFLAILTGGAAGSSTSNRIEQRYTQVFYPGTTDANAASPVEVTSGVELSGIDLVLPAQRFFRVRGRLVDPRTGQPPRSANLRLTNADMGNSGSAGTVREQFYDPTDGSFDLRGVAAGSYVLRADLPSLNPNRGMSAANTRNMSAAERQAYYQAMSEASMAEQAAAPRIAMPLTVNSDVEGLAPAAVVGSGLSGRARIDGTAPRGFRLEQVMIELRAVGPDGAPDPAADSGSRAAANAKPDGAFKIGGLFPGDYRLRALTGLPPGAFVKSARIGDTDVLNGSLTLPIRDPNAVLEVVFSQNTGQIDGKVSAAENRALPGAQVVLIPDANRNRSELFRAVVADATGQFTIPDVAPGEYRLAAWSSLEPFAYFDPAVIRQAEENGKSVKVSESSKQTANVQAITLPDAP